MGPVIKRYFRAEVRGLESMPEAGAALVVSNHSGGIFTPDVLIFAPAFYDKFGFDRPVYTLPTTACSWGTSETGCAAQASSRPAARTPPRRCDPAVVVVFPGGDYDSYRPTFTENVIDFAGRTGYVRTAIETGMPIVPVVSIGAQETQLFLARGDSIARRLGLKRARRCSCAGGDADGARRTCPRTRFPVLG